MSGGNPNHDPKTGEFSSGDGGSAGASHARIDSSRGVTPGAGNGGTAGRGLAQVDQTKHEPFSFTNPNIPLFGPKYQETKSNAAAAVANFRTVMGRIK